MNNQIKAIVFLFLNFVAVFAKAQHVTDAAGGDASGTGGTVAYSVGQLVYTTNSMSAVGSMAQGVQQAFEISIVVGVEEKLVNLNLNAFPNPTFNFLTLTVDNSELSDLNFQLFDIAGKLIETRKIENVSEVITMKNLPASTYFLEINNNDRKIKTFKIIKY